MPLSCRVTAKPAHKYLTRLKRDDFPRAGRSAPEHVRSFRETLTYGGCRVSEALALTASCVHLKDGVLGEDSMVVLGTPTENSPIVTS